MGNPNTKDSGQTLRRPGSEGQPGSAHRRQAALREAARVRHDRPHLNVGAGGDPNAPTAPWGREESLGNDPLSARGNMWGDDHRRLVRRRRSRPLRHRRRRRRSRRRHRPRQHRHPRPRRRHRHRSGLRQRPRSPRRRAPGQGAEGPQGATQVNGRLPPEVIQRIVRQNFGRFRLCYENGLRNNPNLAGPRLGAVRHRSRRRGVERRRRRDRTCRIRASCRASCAPSTACPSRSPKAASSRSSTRSCSTPAIDHGHHGRGAARARMRASSSSRIDGEFERRRTRASLECFWECALGAERGRRIRPQGLRRRVPRCASVRAHTDARVLADAPAVLVRSRSSPCASTRRAHVVDARTRRGGDSSRRSIDFCDGKHLDVALGLLVDSRAP